jgi:serine/threonine protein kinase
LVKPIRISECRALVSKMKKITETPNTEQVGMQKYEKIRDLGHGAAGAVTLIRSKKDGTQYALKTINLKDLQFQSEKDRKNAEMEVQFLRVLQGPTLIKFIESFVENNYIYIVMEYAEGGNLG